jgi:hypothetical protein
MEPKTVPKVVQKGCLLKNTKNKVFAAIYYTCAMSTASKKAPFWRTLGTFFAPFQRHQKNTEQLT